MLSLLLPSYHPFIPSLHTIPSYHPFIANTPWSCVRRVAAPTRKCGACGSPRTSLVKTRTPTSFTWTGSCSSCNGLWKGSLPCSPSMLGRLGLASALLVVVLVHGDNALTLHLAGQLDPASRFCRCSTVQ